MFYNDCYGYGYPTVINTGGSNGNGAWGSDGIWAILLLALLGGFGGRGYGGGYGAGNEFVGYELGKVATQADVASGFNNSAVLSNQNDLKLAIANGFAGVDNAVCTLGYQNQQGINQISREISTCCCDIRTSLLENRYLNERQTCDLITNQNANTQRIIDWLANKELCDAKAENIALKGEISNYRQTNAIVGALSPAQPVPSYLVPNPNCCYGNFGLGYGFGFNNGGCAGIQ